MTTRIGKLIGTMVLVAVVVAVAQMSTPAARASGAGDCPPGNSVFCGNCSLSYALVWPQGGVVITECHYDCWCSGGGGGGEPMYIEQTVNVYD